MGNVQDGRNLNFEFNGNAGEYFKIWIVNIALSILTLGIYSAWAKVRTNRYFYGNTTLDGSSFEYLAEPMTILKGRLIVVGFIILYALTTQFIPMLEIAFFIIYMLALPWMVIKSMQFNARNSAYRNIRFNFDGKIREAISVFIGLPIFCLLTLGFGIPYFIKRIKQFSIEHSYFGKSKFDFNASAGNFYEIYVKAFLVPMVLGMMITIIVSAYVKHIERPQLQTPPQVMQMEKINIEQEPEQQIVNNQQLPNVNAQSNVPAAPDEAAIFISVIMAIATMAIYILIGVYIQTCTANLVLCSTTLNTHKLESRLRVRNMFYIFVTNMFAAIISLGMLIPWCQIRLARYRFENMALITDGSIDNFIADEQNDVKATAGEFTDAFDLDLGL